jgi:cobalamin biosynthesis Mg chelatase CobN
VPGPLTKALQRRRTLGFFVPSLKLLARVTIVATALLGAVVHASPAVAATPCWKALLNDWYDGRIDHTYAVHCYQEALHHLPADVQTYSSAHDDILRALQSAIAKEKKAGETVQPNSPVAPQTATTTTTGTTGQSSTTGTTTVAVVVGRKPDKGLGGVAEQLNPSSSTSLPLPLLVLVGLAILLVAAGAAGLVAKRMQARKQAP